jgi:hypothetical protein
MSNTAPNAPTLTAPISSVTVDYANIQRFSWIFSDPDVGDSQSQFDLQYRIIGAGSWTTVSATTPNNFYDLPAATLTANNYEWQVRTYDSIGVVGPWSASSFFTAATAPSTLSITAPASGATVSAAPTLIWSTPSQTSYQIQRVRDIAGTPDLTTIYSDTGEIIASAVRSVALAMDTNNRYEWIRIRIKSAGLWSSWVSIRVLVSYTQPSPGTITAAGDDSTGSLLITTTAAAVGGGEPTPIFVDIYVRVAGTTGFGNRIATNQFPTGIFRWYAPISGVTYEVRSLTTADNGTQRWSASIFVHFFDGGTPVAPVWTILLDGGLPATVFANNVDGGTP